MSKGPRSSEPFADSASDSAEVVISEHLYQHFLELSTQVRQLLARGPSWILANDGEDGREFDPASELGSFHKFMRKHPRARSSFVYHIESEPLGQLSAALSAIDSQLEIGQMPSEDDPSILGATGPQTDRGIDAVLQPIDADSPSGFADDDETERIAHAQALTEAADEKLFVCVQCGSSALTRLKDRSTVALSTSTAVESALRRGHRIASMDIDSCEVDTLVCNACGHSEEMPWSMATKRHTFCSLIARRLLMNTPVEARDIYMCMGDLYEKMVASGELLLETLHECTHTIHNPDCPTFDGDGIFTGHYVLDIEDDWELNAYELLEAIGLIRNVGGILFRPVVRADRMDNPFSTPMMSEDDQAAPGVH